MSPVSQSLAEEWGGEKGLLYNQSVCSGDDKAELKAEGVQYYQELIGGLRWAVELDHVDILYEVATMSTHLVMPRIGHLEELLHIFGYLKLRPKRKLAFDPDYPMINERQFKQCNWYNFYRDAKEAIPGDMPPRTHCFVDADYRVTL
jgi:hypothetical protein